MINEFPNIRIFHVCFLSCLLPSLVLLGHVTIDYNTKNNHLIMYVVY
jgi:hypothetical protein